MAPSHCRWPCGMTGLCSRGNSVGDASLGLLLGRFCGTLEAVVSGISHITCCVEVTCGGVLFGTCFWLSIASSRCACSFSRVSSSPFLLYRVCLSFSVAVTVFPSFAILSSALRNFTWMASWFCFSSKINTHCITHTHTCAFRHERLEKIWHKGFFS